MIAELTVPEACRSLTLTSAVCSSNCLFLLVKPKIILVGAKFEVFITLTLSLRIN